MWPLPDSPPCPPPGVFIDYCSEAGWHAEASRQDFTRKLLMSGPAVAELMSLSTEAPCAFPVSHKSGQLQVFLECWCE